MHHDPPGPDRPSPDPARDLPLADELSAVSARVAGLLLSEETVATALGLVSSLALDTVPGAVGAGVSIVDERGRRSSGSTDTRVERADALQYELDEGPCLAAAAGRRLVRVDDLTRDRRWPRWAEAVSPLGLRAAMRAPLVAGDTSLGALKVYAEDPGTFDVHAERRLTMSSAQAAILVANAQTRERARQLSEGLRHAVRMRDLVSTAKGVVMAQHGSPRTSPSACWCPLGRGGRAAGRRRPGGGRVRRPPTTVTSRPGPGRHEDSSEEGRRRALRSALEVADLTVDQLWTRYFAIGGHADVLEVEGHLQGLMSLPPAEVDVLAHALNERLDELLSQRRVPYHPPVRRGRLSGSFAALLSLVEAAHLAPPDRLPALVTEAGTAMGVEVTVHVADHEQRRLWPLLPSGTRSGDSLPIDGSLPGRVFQTVRPLPSEADGVRRLWLPLLDGAQRVGVLEVRVGTPVELYDPGLREECRWLSELVGSLLVSMGQYGDGLERPRRTRPRTPPAELLWRLLPPLTAGSGSFVLAGMLEPAYEAGGDAFDYALSETTVSLAAFDAMGHGLPAAALAATAVSAYRSARRDGRGSTTRRG